jgi:hypothetical protein
MSRFMKIAVLKTCLICLISGCAAYRNYTAKIDVNTDNSSYRLTTSVSDFVLILQKKGFIPLKPLSGGATENPRYFHFIDDKTKLNVSGWFEPHYLYHGQKKYFEELAEEFSNNGLPTPYNIEHFRHHNWRVTSYNMPCKTSNSSDIQAHFYEDNTWINLHISYECDTGKNLDDLLQFLNKIQVVKK